MLLSLSVTALPNVLFSSVFQLSYTPSGILSDAEIGILEAATLSVLQGALQNDNYWVNQTQVVFALQKQDQLDTLTFQASTVSTTKNPDDWQLFVEETLLANTDLVFHSVRSELDFLTSLSIEVAKDDAPQERIFTWLDWILLAVSIVLFGVFIYLMFLNYRDWKNDRPPRNIEDVMTEHPVHKLTEPKHDDSKELHEIVERFTVASDANTSPTSSSTKEQQSPPFRCADQDACSLEAALSGLSDLVHNAMRPEPSVDGTMPSNATSDVFDTIVEDAPAPEWMKRVRISVLDSSSSLASRDSLKHAMVDATSTIGSELSTY